MATVIKSIRLEEFKSFQDTKEVPLGRLTIIFGKNNVGKSSLLQSLLLLRQTLDAPEAAGRLTLRGDLFDGGGYADVVHMHQSSQNIRFSIRISTSVKHVKEDYLVISEYSSDEPRPPRLANLIVSKNNKELFSIKRGSGQGGPFKYYVMGKLLQVEKHRGDAFDIFDRSLFPRAYPDFRKYARQLTKGSETWIECQMVLGHLQDFLRTIRAIGPFRSQPTRRYEYSGLARSDVEIHGNNVIDALIHDSLRRGRSKGGMLDSVNKWLGAVGRVKLMPIRRIARSAKLYELRVRDRESGRWANISDIGSGIAQALPVLVEGLRTSTDGLYIVQEPEIHLHPDGQLAMADFLISLSKSGRMVIVETHSENFLLRIRKRLLESQSGIKNEDVSVLVVEKSKNGSSTVKRIQLDDLSQPIGWPKGFMQDVTRERLSLMDAMGRKAFPKKKRTKKKR
jgi:predicted ATPase